MRIIAGEWRGRKLLAPPGEATRPTADRAREALFSMLVSRLGSLEGLTVADLFAGSGALGLEALSRGAAQALFVEQAAPALRALRGNIANLGGAGRSQVEARSVFALGPRATPVDIMLLDPPYGSGAGAVAIERCRRLGWIGPATWLSLETAADEPAKVSAGVIDAERRVGAARLTLLRLSE